MSVGDATRVVRSEVSRSGGAIAAGPLPGGSVLLEPRPRPEHHRRGRTGAATKRTKGRAAAGGDFAADVAGYSRLMSQDEAGTLRALAAAREVMDGLIRDHGGRIANTAGDSVLAEFPSAVDAVQCAVAVQEKLAEASAGEPEDRRLQFGSAFMLAMWWSGEVICSATG